MSILFKKYKKEERGFVILFTVLIAIVMVVIAAGLSLISFKELRLSSSAREAHIAFFAADSGLECALYHDSNGFFLSVEPVFSIDCNDQLNPFTETEYPNFAFQLPLRDGATCATVRVFKSEEINGVNSTRIESFGHNAPCDTNTPTKVERALRATYPNVPIES